MWTGGGLDVRFCLGFLWRGGGGQDSRPIFCVGGIVGMCNFGFLVDVVDLVRDGEVRVSL